MLLREPAVDAAPITTSRDSQDSVRLGCGPGHTLRSVGAWLNKT